MPVGGRLGIWFAFCKVLAIPGFCKTPGICEDLFIVVVLQEIELVVLYTDQEYTGMK